MTLTEERWAAGKTFADYMAGMSENQETFAANYTSFQPDLSAADQAGFEQPPRVMVLTEDWCGDAYTYLPALGRLAQTLGWEIRVLRRDDNLDLADQYLNQGKWRSVPVVVFFDERMHELARFIERPALANRERQTAIDAIAAEDATVAAGLPYVEQSEEGKARISPVLRELRRSRKVAWQQAAVVEVLAALAQRSVIAV